VRALVTADRLRRVIQALGERARGPGHIYLTGGATAVLEGWRQSTVDIDLKLDPEPAGVFESIAAVKDELDVNVELAAPDQFIPPLPGWRDRSPHIARVAEVDFFHYDLYAQALAKLERGHARDVTDVEQMVRRGLVDPARLWELFEAIRPELLRYPAIDADSYAETVRAFVGRYGGALG
jgi:hypothetical protein